MIAEAQLLARAQSGDETAFDALTEAFRSELHVHCYRIVGSVQDAEDLVQEVLVAAWRALAEFEGRSSVRSWLYRIATNRCLNHLRSRGRRLPELPAPIEPVPRPPEPTRMSEPLWLEPYPNVLLADRAQEPDARYESREAISLAFMFALQRLPPRQRAVLVLRDVLGFRAAEVAETLGATEVAVNRMLQRARQAVDRSVPPGALRDAPLPDSREERELVSRFATAFQAGDIERVIADRRDVAERPMFGGLTFMLGGNTCRGVNRDELIVWLDSAEEDAALTRAHARPMGLTGRRMRGFVTVRSAGLKGRALNRWVAQAVARAETLPPKQSPHNGTGRG